MKQKVNIIIYIKNKKKLVRENISYYITNDIVELITKYNFSIHKNSEKINIKSFEENCNELENFFNIELLKIKKTFKLATEKFQKANESFESDLNNLKQQYIIKKEELKKINNDLSKKQENHKKEQEQLEINKLEKNDLYKYLEENTKYEKGNYLSIDEIKNGFNEWSGKNVSKIDNGIFLQVNKEFAIKKKTICKDCKNDHKKSCCDKYTRSNKSSKNVIFNISFIKM